jgi:hypothetical protein
MYAPATAANVHADKISKSGDNEGSRGSGDTLGTKWENEREMNLQL